MVTQGLATLFRTTTPLQRRFGILISNITVRLLIAFAIGWLVILLFFVSGAVSH